MEKIVREVQKQVALLRERKDRIIIAIDGSCTSGKTTLAAALEKEFDCNVFHMDDFFLRPEQRTPQRMAEVGGNVDYERFREEILLPLGKGEPFSYRPYDCKTGSLRAPVAVQPKAINIVEGTYSHHPYFGNAYDLRICLRVCPEIRWKRILERPAFLHKRFREEWIPREQDYFETFAIEENCDLLATPEENWKTTEEKGNIR